MHYNNFRIKIWDICLNFINYYYVNCYRKQHASFSFLSCIKIIRQTKSTPIIEKNHYLLCLKWRNEQVYIRLYFWMLQINNMDILSTILFIKLNTNRLVRSWVGKSGKKNGEVKKEERKSKRRRIYKNRSKY